MASHVSTYVEYEIKYKYEEISSSEGVAKKKRKREKKERKEREKRKRERKWIKERKKGKRERNIQAVLRRSDCRNSLNQRVWNRVVPC